MRWINAVTAVILLAYPLMVYYGLTCWGVRVVSGILIGFFIIRLTLVNRSKLSSLRPMAWTAGLVGIVLAVVGALLRHDGLLLFYPVVINMVMLVFFAFSIWKPPTIIEQFARLKEPDLPVQGVEYTRSVTLVWCVFFVINGSISLATCYAHRSLWLLYNGLISYGLIGALFLVELGVRGRLRKQWI